MGYSVYTQRGEREKEVLLLSSDSYLEAIMKACEAADGMEDPAEGQTVSVRRSGANFASFTVRYVPIVGWIPNT